ncbi:hypothetical protein RQP46_008142 [Phenoliferia psychrophenolica]
MRPAEFCPEYGSYGGEQSPRTPLHSPSPSSDSLDSYISNTPSDELSYSYFDALEPDEPLAALTSPRRLVRRGLAMALLVLFLLGASMRSTSVPSSSYSRKTLLASSEMESAARLPATSELEVDGQLQRSGLDSELAAKTDCAVEHAFWLGLGANSWTTPTNYKRRSWGHTTFSPPSPRHSIQVVSQSFFASKPAHILTQPDSHIVGFSVQLSPDSLTYGKWKATFFRPPATAGHVRSAIRFEASTPIWLEVARWAVSWRCFGMCSELGDATYWANVYVAVEGDEKG